MRTRRIYHEDPEARTFEASVLSVRPGPEGSTDVILDQTAFYPTGGGQPHDTGSLGGLRVLDVLEDASEVVHRVGGGTLSGRVTGEVDWARRLDHRQQHTGQHILSRAFLSLREARTIGFHLGQETCTIDLDRESSEESVDQAERLANDVVLADHPIEDQWYEDAARLPGGMRKEPTVSGPIRIVSIGSFDATPCGGTHCGRSGQVGSIKVLRTERRRGGSRIEFVCGTRALEDHGRRLRALRGAALLLSTEDLRLPERIRGLLEEMKDHRSRLETAEEALRAQWLETLVALPAGALARVLAEARADWLGPLALALSERRGFPVLLATGEDPEARVVFAVPEGSAVNAGRCLRELLVEVGGKGGGAERLGQGKIPASKLPRLFERWNETIS
jgi:alanyl-tRNA synthetase